MTTITLSTTNPRSLDAVRLAATSNRWLRCVHRSSGERVTGIQSQTKKGLVHLTTLLTCSCADTRYRPSETCKHRLALRLFTVLSAVPA